MRILLPYFFCLFCLTRLVFGGRLKPQGRVSGATEAADDLALHIVSIQNSAREHLCAGTIIAEQWILTTGRCAKKPFEHMWIATGSIDRTKPDAVYYVALKVAHHFHEESRFANDIGLMKVDRPIVFDGHTQPIKIARTNNLEKDDKLMIAGWGSENKETTVYSQILMTAEVNYITSEKCRTLVQNPEQINAGHICTDSKNGVFGTWGDSGGPLTNENNLLVGIISWGVTNTVDVYVNVAYYYDWINSFTNKK